MVTKTQRTITADAWQWLGGDLATYTLPTWAQLLSIQNNGDGTLSVPCRDGYGTAIGTFRAIPTDWIISSTAGVDVFSNADMLIQFS